MVHLSSKNRKLRLKRKHASPEEKAEEEIELRRGVAYLDEKVGLVVKVMKKMRRGEDELWHMTCQSRIGNGNSSTTICL